MSASRNSTLPALLALVLAGCGIGASPGKVETFFEDGRPAFRFEDWTRRLTCFEHFRVFGTEGTVWSLKAGGYYSKYGTTAFCGKDFPIYYAVKPSWMREHPKAQPLIAGRRYSIEIDGKTVGQFTMPPGGTVKPTISGEADGRPD